MVLSTIYYSIGLLVLIFNAVMFAIIKFNDLKHLDITMKEVKISMEKLGEKVEKASNRISRIEGVLSIKEEEEK